MARTRKKNHYKLLNYPWLQKLSKSVWLFPLICLIFLLLFTCLKISGSSVGIYYKDLYGPNSKDPNLVIGSPRSIRSDEWEWQTNMTIAQYKADFPRVNPTIGSGQDMETIVDVPYKDWSVIFKPQNLAFFILPLDYAFSFKWWLLAFLLVVSTYFFVLLLLPRKRLLAALLSISLFFSPFIQWWYQTITIAPIAYGFLMVLAVINLWKARGYNKFWWSLMLAYILSCFAIIAYPPFQIPCLLVTLVFSLGYFIDKKFFTNKKQLRSGILHIAFSLIIFIVILSSFIATNKRAISATQNSLYPGQRISLSGHFDGQVFLGNFLDSQLQLSRKALNYVANQSEAANFLLLAPFLSIPSLYWLITKYRKTKKIDWILLTSTSLFLISMARLFVPGTDLLFKPLLLSSVPNNRLIIGIGMISFMQLVAVMRFLDINKVRNLRTLAILTSVLTLTCNLVIGFMIRQDHPGYIHMVPLVIFLSCITPIIIYLLLNKKFVTTCGILLMFSFISAGAVHPIYRGIGALYKSQISRSIESIALNDPTSKWAIVDNLVYENLPSMSNASSITGIYAYPQVSFWSSVPELRSQQDIYNRYAHTQVKFSVTPAKLALKQADFFEIIGTPCSDAFKNMHVKYFISEKDYSVTYNCLSVKQIVSYPNKTFYISELR